MTVEAEKLDTDKLYKIRDAKRFIGNPSTNTVYKLIKEQKLEALKMGRSTLLTGRSLAELVNKLPRF